MSQMSLRVTPAIWEPETEFSSFLARLNRLQALDEVALLTGDIHIAPSLEKMTVRAGILKKRISALEAAGYHAGINILCTLGHAAEDRKGAESLTGELFMDIDGNSSPGNFCPQGEIWRNSYLKPVYRMLAEAGPEFIWIDDDLRLHNHGAASYGCFCDGCFRKLSEYFGFHGSRREFAGFFDRGSAEELRERRLKMLEWNRQVLASAFIFIRQTVHEVNPDIILGKMDCLDLWESDRRRQASLLGGEGGGSVWWRPGGGAYCDTDLEELIRKADTIAAEAAMLPPVVTVIQSELENFPYSRLQKSTSFTALETSLYCAAGCTGTALNLLGDPASAPPECYEPYLLELKEQRRFNDKIVRLNRGRPLRGIWFGKDKDYFLGAETDFLRGGGFPVAGNDASRGFQGLGLPYAYAPEHALCGALSGREARALSDEAVLQVLSTGGYLDADAVRVLIERGYGGLIGFSIGKIFDADALEESVAHPLNPAPFRRNIRQSFWGGRATEFIPQAAGAEILSRLVDYAGNEIAPCCSGTFTNALGGRVAVAGYGAWNLLGHEFKYRQIHAVFRWLAADALDAEVPECRVRTKVYARTDEGSGVTAAVFNWSLEPAENLTVRLRTAQDKALLVRNRQAESMVSAVGRDGGFADFQIPVNALELVYLDTSRESFCGFT